VRQNEKGMTLIELLAALFILGMVASILYSFMLMGVSMYKRVTVETQMRNQGDTLYSQIISELKDAIYVQQAGSDKEIRYAKRSPDSKTYIELYEMKLLPNENTGGKIEIRKAGTAAPERVFQLGSRFTIIDGSLNEISHDRVQVKLTYARSNAGSLKAAESPKLEIDSQIPLFRIE
jgi:prepilin-type N-terminal cleavage/methylation domain-containing protein